MNLYELLSNRCERDLLAKDQLHAINFSNLPPSGDATILPPVGVTIVARNPIYLLQQLLTLDGCVHSMLLLSPSLGREAIVSLMRDVGTLTLLTDREDLQDLVGEVELGPRNLETSWLLTTSGTTGIPKVVQHTLRSITATTKIANQVSESQPRWGLLFEMSRFAGLQVAMQALLGGGILLAPTGHDLAARVKFLIGEECSHLSATPTLWRKLLMMPESDQLRLKQITIGGEIADSHLLNALRQKHPNSRVTHIYASTEIGVGFPVNDGIAGFPLDYVTGSSGTKLKIVEGVLWAKLDDARSVIAARHIERDSEEYVCTGDRVEVKDGRVLFLGRESSLVNVGGVKIQIEEVEEIIRQCGVVADCTLEAKKNAFSGAVLSLLVSLKHTDFDHNEAKTNIRDWCRLKLQREAQPATIRIVDSLEMSSSGKIVRTAG
ncbi:AMP-binding protein [Rhizobium leguminosarum]|uniref:AMP-binding protein n=1 Tax=Rhizobium leguminosarum TaxID=384 RepID=UPI001C96D9DC|nr:class I adenylate-forming enzyme family protein [Rhizobium leguminosarum]MBY5663144.1 acyl--CoA ligase [Rhizobium leguminosarum]MBY5676347.1 acyl--CoA ligase [Rhizobium leguminosarum]